MQFLKYSAYDSSIKFKQTHSCLGLNCHFDQCFTMLRKLGIARRTRLLSAWVD